ncbi:MAG: AAA family ATPase [Eubacteriales bacterium]|nr:AAA family ATPase [Eubacteriales bacterium]
MKLLHVKANHFKNCVDEFEIDFVARSKKTAEDKEYELQEIADDLYVYNTVAFVGKNASGKTTAVELLDACFSILGEFRLEAKPYSYDQVELLIDFFHENDIYRYETTLKNSDSIGSKAIFTDQKIQKKKYYKSNIKNIYSEEGFSEVKVSGELPEDTSNIFFILKKKQTRAIYFDSFGKGADTYRLLFAALKDYNISTDILGKVLTIFDENISDLQKLDDHNYKMLFYGQEKIVSDKELLYKLSSGTTKGMFLYILVVASLQNGFDLIVDEIENHFHKTLVENMISLYKDKTVNRQNATLIFTTHYCELLDLFNRQDNIFIAKAGEKIYLTNMYSGYDVRPELLKSRQFYQNVFQTAVNYEELMRLKKALKK